MDIFLAPSLINGGLYLAPNQPPPAASGDSTNPILGGSVSITNITSSGFTASWQAATDNVGVVGYEVSTDTGTAAFSQVGNVLTVNVTGKAASTAYTFRVQAYDAAGLKSNTLTASVTTAAPAGDTQDPAMSGSVVISAVSLNSLSASWQAGSDNIGVASYEISVDTGTPSYTNIGNTLSYAASGLASATAYTVRVRAVDAAGRKSAPITGTATTQTPAQLDTENPAIPGTLSITNVTPSGLVVGWQAGSDNVGVTGYEVSVDVGTPSYVPVGTFLTKVVAGLTPSTTYTIRVRAFDAAGNRSTALTTSATTAVQPVGTAVVVVPKQSVELAIETLAALSTGISTLSYVPNTAQELIMFNKSGSDVVVTIRGSAAGVVNVKGAVTKTLDLSLGLPVNVPAGQFVSLRLDSAVAYLKGDVTVTAAVNGVVFAGLLQ